MKKWKKWHKWKRYPLLLALLVSGIFITGAGYIGEGSLYADYTRVNGWMTPELSKVFQGWKDGVYPWELLTRQAQQASAEAKADGLADTGLEAAAGEDGQGASDGTAADGIAGGGPAGAEDTQNAGADGTASAGSQADNSVLGNSVSDGSVSDNSVSGNSVSGNGVSDNGTSDNSVSGNGVPGGDTSDGGASEETQSLIGGEDGLFMVEGSGAVYDEFGRKVADAPSASGTPETENGQQPAEGSADVASGEGAAETTQQTEDSRAEDTQTEDTQAENAQTENMQTEDTASEEKQDGLNLGALAAEQLGLKETQEEWQIGPVAEEYFNDALFIGDSRTVGLDEYGGFQDETTFYAATSLTIYNLFDSPKKFAVLADGSKATLEEALAEKQFGKIYLMLGINELGRGTTESFFKVYADAVNRIRQLQPDALIFIQGIMRVSGQKSSTDPVYNNVKINERNQALAAMADRKSIFYLEVNDAVCDENGDLITDYTYDQIHLKAKYYQLWKDYLYANGAVKP